MMTDQTSLLLCLFLLPAVIGLARLPFERKADRFGVVLTALWSTASLLFLWAYDWLVPGSVGQGKAAALAFLPMFAAFAAVRGKSSWRKHCESQLNSLIRKGNI